MRGPEPADSFRAGLGFSEIPTPVFVLQEFDFGLSGQNTHAFPNVLRDSYLALAGYAHNDHRFVSNT